MVNITPLWHENFVKAQRIMSKHFHVMAKYKWVGFIAKEMRSYISGEFDFDDSKYMHSD